MVMLLVYVRMRPCRIVNTAATGRHGSAKCYGTRTMQYDRTNVFMSVKQKTRGFM